MWNDMNSKWNSRRNTDLLNLFTITQFMETLKIDQEWTELTALIIKSHYKIIKDKWNHHIVQCHF